MFLSFNQIFGHEYFSIFLEFNWIVAMTALISSILILTLDLLSDYL